MNAEIGKALAPWQTELWQRVHGQLLDERLPHACMLGGAEGIGKRAFALALAARRLCRSPQQANACGQCKACRLLAAGSHPDLLQVYPEGNSRALKIDQVRQISEFVNKTASFTGSARIVVLEPAEGLGGAAANALLKSLEEPPGDSLFLLISHVPGAVLATIRSRCQLLAMPQPDESQSAQWLREHIPDPQEAADAAALAPRRPLRALRLSESGITSLHRYLHEAALKLSRGETDALSLASDCKEPDPALVVDFVRHYIAALIKQALTGGNRYIHGQGAGPAVQVERRQLDALFAFYRELETLQRQLAGPSNPNPQLTLETLFLRWKDILQQCH